MALALLVETVPSDIASIRNRDVEPAETALGLLFGTIEVTFAANIAADFRRRWG